MGSLTSSLQSITLILILCSLLNFEQIFGHELKNSNEHVINSSERTSDRSNHQINRKHSDYLDRQNDPENSEDLSQSTKKPINCDRIDSGFFSYLLKRYNRDDSQSGRMERLCDNLDYAATHCHQTKDNLFKLIHSPAPIGQMNEDDHNFSQSIIRLCPLILFRVSNRMCTSTVQSVPDSVSKPNPKQVWLFAFVFVTIISCCSLVGVVVVPFSNTDSYKDAFNLFEGLAVGSLVASSLFHLLPQAFNLTASKDDDYLVKAMLIFGGIYLFFWSEILMKLMAELRKRNKKKSICQSNLELLENEAKLIRELKIQEELDSNESTKKERDESEQKIAQVAWLIIFGDGLHNFIDGLSIGAAFSESLMSGVSISIAVICEELPHELGDFAILVASGMSMNQALYYNFLSSWRDLKALHGLMSV